MPKSHFTDEFKINAVRQITERGYSVAEVSARLGDSIHPFICGRRSSASLLMRLLKLIDSHPRYAA